jgi:hypothetical protein
MLFSSLKSYLQLMSTHNATEIYWKIAVNRGVQETCKCNTGVVVLVVCVWRKSASKLWFSFSTSFFSQLLRKKNC